MGYDAIFQALPDKEEILELARSDYDWSRMLASPKQYRHQSPLRLRTLQQTGNSKKLTKFDEFYDKWYDAFYVSLNWGRKWDTIAYLLVEARRVYSQDEIIALYENEGLVGLSDRDRLLYRAIMGGDCLWETSKPRRASGASEILRYMPSSEVHDVYQLLRELSLDDLLEHYNELEMDKALLYKFHPSSDTDKFVEAFILLRNFYYEAQLNRAIVLYELI